MYNADPVLPVRLVVFYFHLIVFILTIMLDDQGKSINAKILQYFIAKIIFLTQDCTNIWLMITLGVKNNSLVFSYLHAEAINEITR